MKMTQFQKINFKRLRKCFFLLSFLVIICFGMSSEKAYALNTPQDYTLMLSAVGQKNPAQITLNWPNNATNTGTYNVYRKNKEDVAWGTYIAQLPTGSVSYTDTNVVVGKAYEYKVSMNAGTFGEGYIYAGIDVPAIEQRGKVVLVVDNTYLSQIGTEVNRLERDLAGDGWIVLRHDVSASDTPQSVKSLIKADYDFDPNNVKSVFLFGHVPIFKSGNMAPDGHDPTPWPADSFYGDMNVEWNSSTPPVVLPSDVELQVGRVDMSFLPAFAPLDEPALLKRYLDKDHKYRQGLMNLQRRGAIYDLFGLSVGEPFAANGWGNFPQLTNGPTSIQTGDWKTLLSNSDYLFSYICGAGEDTAVGVSSYSPLTASLITSDLAAYGYKSTFAFMFGSHFGEWDRFNNLLRGFIAMPDYGLTNAWAGRPNWYIHHMSMGESIGYSTRLTQNNSTLYKSGVAARMVHVALMGDPTLRLYPVKPPANVRVVRGDGKNVISWDTAEPSVLGYYVYRLNTETGSYERITTDIVTNKFFEDTNSYSYSNYMVRSVTLENNPSGTFYCLSQGSFENVSIGEVSYTNGNGGFPQNLIRNTYLMADATVYNQGASDQNMKFIIALYNSNNTLKSISVSTNKVNAWSTQKIKTGFYLPENVDNCYVKTFLWNDLDNIQNLNMTSIFDDK